MNITSSLLSESSEEIQDFLQRKNKNICPQEALLSFLNRKKLWKVSFKRLYLSTFPL